jgi:hypothetical protein
MKWWFIGLYHNQLPPELLSEAAPDPSAAEAWWDARP